MLLAVDIGNTNLTAGLYQGKQLLKTFRAETVRSKTADEYAATFRQLLLVHGIEYDKVKAGVIASVVPQLTEVVKEAIGISFDVTPLVVGPGVKTGVSVRYDTPHDVGADRVVNALAVYERYKSAAIVVDFGTATTFDCISKDGEYLGGVILPGIQVSLDALMSRAAKLRPVELSVPPTVIGRNTAHSLQSGVVYGYSSLIDGMVAKLKPELGEPCKVLATGGLATLLAPHTAAIEEVDHNITLEGLRIIYERNTARRQS